jgi:mannose-1-phosphate guanylyltransferase/mannose-6-phosphate isomerase
MKMIVMAGGSGARLWPLSRTHFPKQFLKLADMDRSIFQMTIERCLLMGSPEDIYIVTSRDYLHLVQRQIDELGIALPREQILLEPKARNTLPAILFAVQAIREKGDDICAVFASDHVIDEPQILADTVLGAIPLASRGFVCFGITPTSPETGFGYIKPGATVDGVETPGGFEVAEFKEKPDFETACRYVEDGYLWNSGMFLFDSEQFFYAVKKYNPEVFEAFQAEDIKEKFRKTPSISIDYGLIEKMDKVYGAPMVMAWNDVGNFTTLYDRYQTKQDDNGNVYFNDEIMLDSNRNLVYTEGEKIVAMIGVSDIVVVDQKDALLICHRDESKKVKDVVDALKERKDTRADHHKTVYKPWGSYTILEEYGSYKVKRLTVLPGNRLSYQMHYHRSEHWIVVNGTAVVMLDDVENLVRTGESIFIDAGAKHRLINAGNLLLEVIEVQNGQYLGEDDIVRFEDDYVRE